jgi:lysozyme
MIRILTFLCNFASVMRFKGYFIYIIIGIIWGCDTHEAAKTLNGIEGDSIVGWHTSEHDSAIESRALRVAAELGYYLERHTENDEGYDMVARYAAQGDSALGYYMPRLPLSLRNVGHWRCLPRSGTGLVVDALGRLVIGTFADDTLVGGIRLDKEGVYAGRLTRNAEASGHGAYRSLDDSYYEGQWSMDMRQGFGFCVSPSFLHAGHWRRNRFIG